MQYNSPKKNTSNILRSTEESKRKSRHRLMGSIFLLLVALIVLLNVTSKVKPVAVNPKTIEIQNTANQTKPIAKKDTSGVATLQVASQALAIKPSAIAITAGTTAINHKAVSSDAQVAAGDAQVANNTPNEQTESNRGYRASVIEKDNTPANNDKASTNTEQSSQNDNAKLAEKHNNHLALSPRIVTEKTASKPTPEQILNGDTGSSAKTSKYYIQFMASNDKDKLLEVKSKLANNGIRSFIQETQNANGATIYRLRMGPFKTHDEANKKLSAVNNKE